MGGMRFSDHLTKLARDKGLEEYLRNPEKARMMIRSLVVLLDEMQREIHEKGRREKVGPRPGQPSFMKLYPQGKFVLHYLPMDKFEEEAVEGFKRAATTYAALDQDWFTQYMRSQNAPDEVIRAYLKYYYIRDDSYVALEPF